MADVITKVEDMIVPEVMGKMISAKLEKKILVSKIANEVKHVPAEYINAEGNGITEAGLNYLKPLIIGELAVEYEAGMPKHIVL